MTSTPTPFTGFPPEALAFYDGLEEDNSRSYWLANKTTFEDAVRAPMAALLAALPQAYQPFRAFRPHRDLRFSSDKSPYKTQHGAVGETDRGVTWYVHVGGEGVLVASGMYVMAVDQLARFRRAVADDTSGPHLERLVADLHRSKITVGPGLDEPLKTAPRGYPRDHPRIGLLRWKACVASAVIGSPSVIHSNRLRGRVVSTWEHTASLVAWLEQHVGPSNLPKDARR